MHLKRCTSNPVHFLFQISSLEETDGLTHTSLEPIDVYELKLRKLLHPVFLLVPLLLVILLLERENGLIENPDCVRVSLPTRSLRIQPGFTFSKSWIWAESSKAIRPRAGRPLSFSSSVRVRRESKVYLYSSTAFFFFLNTVQIYMSIEQSYGWFQHSLFELFTDWETVLVRFLSHRHITQGHV